MPVLYVVATPIGNLEDITLRAVRLLKEVKLIAAEDTRKTRRLLSAYDIKTPTTSYHEHNKLTKLDYILSQLEKDDVALVSDAGMPGISDPGYELISAVNRRNIPIVPIPGPSVIVTAMVVSGLPTDSFCYLGFLPHKSGERRRLLEARAAEKSTLVLFESPHRIQESLLDMLEVLGDRKAAVCRELTKIHEEVFRGTLSQAVEHFKSPRGEFTLVIAGQPEITDVPFWNNG
jgi:16S rRNA (cytidine1402-2'-O)-methyltransferase